MPHAIKIFFTKSTAKEKIQRLLPNVLIINVVQDFIIIPQTEELYDTINQLYHNSTSKYNKVFTSYTEATEIFLKEVSQQSLISYFETDYHGGYGTQSSVLFKNGNIQDSPSVLNDYEHPVLPKRDLWPINKVLIKMGVIKNTNLLDEFDTINLGNYRINKDFYI